MRLLLILLALVALPAWGTNSAERFCSERYAELLKYRRELAKKQFEKNHSAYARADSGALQDQIRFHTADLESARKQAAAMVESGGDEKELARQLTNLEEQNKALITKQRGARKYERNNVRQWLEYLGKERLKLAAMPSGTFAERTARWKSLNDLLAYDSSFRAVTATSKNPHGTWFLPKQEHEALLAEQAATWREIQATLSPSEARTLWWKQGYHDVVDPTEKRWEKARASYLPKSFVDFGRYLPEPSLAQTLAKRLEQGDRHAKTLLRMGYRHDPATGLVPPESYFTLVEAINREIDVAIQAGQLTEETAFRPSLYFQSRKRWDDSKLVRVGIDPWPDPREFVLARETPQFDNSTWQKYLSGGKFPLMPGGFLEHDASHWSEFLDEPRLMAETRNHFRRWESLRKEKSFSEGIDHLSLKPGHDSTFALGFRTMLFTEFFSLPDVARKKEILAKFPELAAMSKRAAANWRAHREELKKRSAAELGSRYERWATQAKPFIARQGGGIRDAYNYEGRFPVDESLGARLEGKRLKPNETHGHWTNEAMMDGSLLNLQSQLSVLRDLRGGNRTPHPSMAGSWGREFQRADRVEQEKIVDETMLTLLAKLESGFRTGLDTGLTPAQVVHDSSVRKMDPNSATGRFVASFSDDYGPLWEAFLSPTARGAAR